MKDKCPSQLSKFAKAGLLDCRMAAGRSLMFIFKEEFPTPLHWTISSSHLFLARKEAAVDF